MGVGVGYNNKSAVPDRTVRYDSVSFFFKDQFIHYLVDASIPAKLDV